MPEEMLNLLDFASGVMTETSARTPKVMGSNTRHAAIAARGRDNRPDYFRTERIRCDPASLVDGAEHGPGSAQPSLNGGPHPTRNGNGAHVAAFPDQISEHPVFLSPLKVVYSDGCEFGTAQPTAEQNSDDRVISLATVDRRRCLACLLQKDAVPGHHGPIEREPGPSVRAYVLAWSCRHSVKIGVVPAGGIDHRLIACSGTACRQAALAADPTALVYTGLESPTRMTDRLSRITINIAQCGGRPCIRGMRLRVSDILDLLSAGATFEEVLEDYPYLEREDILAAIQYAARQTDHPVLLSA